MQYTIYAHQFIKMITAGHAIVTFPSITQFFNKKLKKIFLSILPVHLQQVKNFLQLIKQD